VDQLYLNILRRWLWLIIFAAVLAGATAYVVGKLQPHVYEASTRLIVGPGVDGLNPDLNDLRAGGQLMQTYAELATTRPVLEAVDSELTFASEFNELESNVSVSVDEETQILKISVRDGDPDKATDIANALASVLLSLSPSGGESPAAILNEQMGNQAAEIEETIIEIERRIELHNGELASAVSADMQRTIIDQISSERARLGDAQATLALLYNSLRNTPTNQVKIVELAVTGEPVARRLPLVALVAAMAGLVLALVIALAFEYFDDSITTVDELRTVTDIPLLGTITQNGKRRRDSSANSLVVRELTDLHAAEDYRMLGTKLPVSTDGGQLRLLAISSVQNSVEAGEVAGNLAVVLAQLGRRVILVDANLRHPTLDKLFDISDRTGLSHFLTGRYQAPNMTIVDWAPGLSVLTAGAPTIDAFSKLTSPYMSDLLKQLEGQADIVILVTSPVVSYADSLLLIAKSDGVMLIIRGGDARQGAVQEAIVNLRSIDANVIGTVFLDQTNGVKLGIRGLIPFISRIRRRGVDVHGGRHRARRQSLPTSLSNNIEPGYSEDGPLTKASEPIGRGEDMGADKGVVTP